MTGGFFAVLRVPALHGRTLSPDDDAMGMPDVVVLSHRLWRRRFGGDASIVGRTIAIEEQPFQVAGVMPEYFSYPLNAELWIPQRRPDVRGVGPPRRARRRGRQRDGRRPALVR